MISRPSLNSGLCESGVLAQGPAQCSSGDLRCLRGPSGSLGEGIVSEAGVRAVSANAWVPRVSFLGECANFSEAFSLSGIQTLSPMLLASCPGPPAEPGGGQVGPWMEATPLPPTPPQQVPEPSAPFPLQALRHHRKLRRLQQADSSLRDGDAGPGQRISPRLLRLPALQPEVSAGL